MKYILKHFWPEMKQYKWALALMMLGLSAIVALDTIVPFLIRDFVNALASDFSEETWNSLISILRNFAFVYLGIWFFWRINEFSIVYFESHVIRDLDMKAFAAIQRQPLRFFEERFTGSIVRKVGRFISAFERLTDILYFNFLYQFLKIVLVFLIFTYEKPIFGILFAIWAFIFIAGNYVFSRWKMRYDIALAKADSCVGGAIADSFSNHSAVKTFAQEKYEEKRLYQTVQDRFLKMKFAWILQNYANLVQSVFMIGFEFLFFYFAALWWRSGTFSVGDFVFFQVYLIGMFRGLWEFGRHIRDVFQHLGRAKEMVEILERDIEVKDARNAKELLVRKGKISFQHVTFRYEEERWITEQPDRDLSIHSAKMFQGTVPVQDHDPFEIYPDAGENHEKRTAKTCLFQDFSLTISAGQRVALVGPSGAGKTTIVKLLFRFFDPDKGAIYIDGQNIASVTQKSLRRNISLVPQNPELFHRSIADNIAFGNPTASREEIEHSARIAHAEEFIKELPDGYETLVGERGVKLSGGEKQRVAIARAFLENAPILVLDEATSSLDSLTERKIQDALDTLMRGRTSIVIAHRLSTILRMDRIVVIDKGGIMEDGTHKELLAAKGLYAKLWEHQAGGFLVGE